MSQQKALFLSSKDAGKFTLGTRPIPKPGHNEVLVKNMAVALNPVDAFVEKTGFMFDRTGFPAVSGFDGAGIVHEIGGGVSKWKVGDRIFCQRGTEYDYSTFQEYTLAHADRIARIPEHITFDEASTIPLALATAAIGMYAAHAKPGERSGGAALTAPWEEVGRGKYAGQPILITRGASSVGQFAIQLAKLSGFDPIITTASSHSVDYCKTAGATHVIDYHETSDEQLPAAVSKITSKPFNFIFDGVASDESQEACWKILAPGGTLIAVRTPVVGKPNDVADDGSGKRTVWMFASISSGPHVEMATRMYASLTNMLEKGELKPNKVEVLPNGLAGISDALGRFFTNKVSGVKLVVHPPETP